MPVAFDTLKAARRLQDEAGFSEKQAGVLVSTLAEGVGENLATKADIESESHALRSEMQVIRTEVQALDERTQVGFAAMRAEMQALDERTQVGFAAMRSEMQARDERLLAELTAIRSEMQARDAGTDAREQRLKLHLGAMVAGGVGIILGSIGIVTAIILTAG